MDNQARLNFVIDSFQELMSLRVRVPELEQYNRIWFDKAAYLDGQVCKLQKQIEEMNKK